MREYAALGCDGIVAKLAGAAYQSGDRDAMRAVKRLYTADRVVGGFRYVRGDSNEAGSLPLGLYNSSGTLDHVGFSSSFTGSEGGALRKLVAPLIGCPGFTGRAPGG
jgi:ATP-dependent DNA ligase